MNAAKTTLRVLIVAQFVIGVSTMVLSPLATPAATAALRDKAEPFEYGFSPFVGGILLAIFIAFGVAVVVSWIGLLVFWRPARPLFAVTTLLLLFPTLLGGPHVDDGLSAMLGEMVSIITGAILALVYFSPLKDLYEKRPADAVNKSQ
jgi:hypothetical protein